MIENLSAKQEQIMAIVTVVKTEVQAHLKPVLEALNEDLQQVFGDFETRIRAIEVKLGMAEVVPANDPESPKEL